MRFCSLVYQSIFTTTLSRQVHPAIEYPVPIPPKPITVVHPARNPGLYPIQLRRRVYHLRPACRATFRRRANGPANEYRGDYQAHGWRRLSDSWLARIPHLGYVFLRMSRARDRGTGLGQRLRICGMPHPEMATEPPGG